MAISENVPSWLFWYSADGGRIVGDVDIRPAVVVEVGNRHAQAVGAVRLQDAGLLADIREGAVAVVVKQDVLAALQSRRTARHHDAFEQARAGLRQRRGLRIEIDVVGDEQVQMAVPVVIHERAAGVPAALPVAGIGRDAGLSGDIGELAVAVVVPQRAIAPISDEQVVVAVVVIVADAAPLAPPGARRLPACSVTSVNVPSRLFL